MNVIKQFFKKRWLLIAAILWATALSYSFYQAAFRLPGALD